MVFWHPALVNWSLCLNGCIMSSELGLQAIAQSLQEHIAKQQKAERLLEQSIQTNQLFVDTCHEAYAAI